MNSGQSWAFVQNGLVFLLSVVPLPLQLESLGIHFVGLGRVWRRCCQLHGGSSRKVRVSVGRNVKNFRIVRKFPIEDLNSFESRIGLFEVERATYCGDARFELKLFICEARRTLFQKLQSFLAFPVLGE